MSACVSCKNPSKVKGYPQTREEYTERWQNLPDPPAWLALGKDEILVCQDCQSYWFLFYQHRDMYLEHYAMPEELIQLCHVQAPIEAFMTALKNPPRTGPLRSFLFQISKNRLRTPPLQEHAELILETLQDKALSVETADLLVDLLKTVIFEAVETAFPEKMGLQSPERKAMAEKLRQNLNHSDNIVEAAQQALSQWEQERPLKFLPPLRHLKLKPLLDWLEHFPAGLDVNKPHELQAGVALRDKIRELLLQISRQSQRKPPVLTLEAQSQKELAPYNGLKALTQLAQKKLDAQIQALPHWEYLALADLLAVWRRLQLVQDLSEDTALQLLHLHQGLKPAASQDSSQIPPPPQIMKALEQLLCHLRKLDDYSTQVKQFVRWHLKQ